MLSIIGFAGLVVTILLGFEEPNSLLLRTFSAMLLAAPMAVLVHLTCTRSLTPERKRIWWKEFASAEIWSAFSEYLLSSDLGASADRRANRTRRTKT